MLLLTFAAVLLVSVLVSRLADRTILSTAGIFLFAGFFLGNGPLGVLHLTPDDDLVYWLAELALFATLYTDGMKVGWVQLRRAWRLPGRALLLGMPLTFAITAVLGNESRLPRFIPTLRRCALTSCIRPPRPLFAALT